MRQSINQYCMKNESLLRILRSFFTSFY